MLERSPDGHPAAGGLELRTQFDHHDDHRPDKHDTAAVRRNPGSTRPDGLFGRQLLAQRSEGRTATAVPGIF
jgi:hypothetical protein